MSRPSFLARLLDVPSHRPALHLPAPSAADAGGGRWWTFGELVEVGEYVAGWLAEQGVGRGDRVVIQLENGLPLVAAHLGCMALGAVRVPLNAHYRAAEVAPIVEDAAPVLVIAEDPSLYPGLPVHRTPGSGRRIRDWPAPPDDVTGLLFTSGTTGRAKGVPQTWWMWESNLDAVARRWALTPDDRLHCQLPLFHTHGLVLGLHHTLLRGSSARIGARFDPAPPPADCTHVYGVPTFWRRWSATMAQDPAPFARMRLLVSGSDGLDAALSDTIERLCGHRVLERYGMTETVMITSNPFDGERRAGTVGTPLDDVQVRLVDGEVQVRGPNVFSGYRTYRPGASASAGAGFSEDGWFRTGDAAELDAAGYLRIVGRKKDLVIVGGVNVSPAEVEAVLGQTPGVAEVGVCGLPDEDLNEVVAAAVVLDGTASGEVVLERLRGAALALSGLKRPRAWAFVDRLPRNALGKLQRGRLPAEAPFRRA